MYWVDKDKNIAVTLGAEGQEIRHADTKIPFTFYRIVSPHEYNDRCLEKEKFKERFDVITTQNCPTHIIMDVGIPYCQWCGSKL